MQKTSVEGKIINTFSKQRAYNLGTIGGIHMKNATLLETALLKNFGKLSSLSSKN